MNFAPCMDKVKEGLYVSSLPDFHDENNVSTVAVLSCSASDVSLNRKPVLLSLLMNEKQLQTILDNKHLFDSDLVGSAYKLMGEYEQIQIEYSD